MLRLVIQISMLLALPIMAVCLFVWPAYSDWYIAYVAVFNVLVGPVFSAGSITSERERQTLDLLLTTTITPWQILWGKLVASLRISSVLTLFLAWPLLLATVMVRDYWTNLGAVAAYFGIILATCLTTAMLAMFCSVLFRKTTMSLTTSYLVLLVLFVAPLAISFFFQVFIQPAARVVDARAANLDEIATTSDVLETNSPSRLRQTVPMFSVRMLGLASPFVAAASVPMEVLSVEDSTPRIELYQGDWSFVTAYFATTIGLNVGLMLLMIGLFNRRWRVSQ